MEHVTSISYTYAKSLNNSNNMLEESTVANR